MAKTPQRVSQLRRNALAKDISENLRSNKPLGQSMREVGYSRATSESPSVIIDTPSFQLLLQKYLPDDIVAKRHRFLLNHKKPEAVRAAIDMAYKLKGYYPKDNGKQTPTIINIIYGYRKENGSRT